jgi:hypothetical protein
MRVFLVPVSTSRYQLYVEVAADAAAAEAPDPQASFFSRQAQRFRETLAEAEQERLRRERGEPETGSGLWRAIMRRIAETIAEQRLLWHLRHQTAADLQHPDDLAPEAAVQQVRSEFSRDAAKHLRWMIIDGLAVAITGPVFFFVPGPNVISWYFTFRAVGHLFSWRGARKGLNGIEWRTTPSPPLTAVRAALAAPASERRRLLEEVSAALGLRHLAGFVERVARAGG